MAGTKRVTNRTTEPTFALYRSLHSAAVVSRQSFIGNAPASFTRISMPPNAAKAAPATLAASASVHKSYSDRSSTAGTFDRFGDAIGFGRTAAVNDHAHPHSSESSGNLLTDAARPAGDQRLFDSEIQVRKGCRLNIDRSGRRVAPRRPPRPNSMLCPAGLQPRFVLRPIAPSNFGHLFWACLRRCGERFRELRADKGIAIIPVG